MAVVIQVAVVVVYPAFHLVVIAAYFTTRIANTGKHFQKLGKIVVDSAVHQLAIIVIFKNIRGVAVFVMVGINVPKGYAANKFQVKGNKGVYIIQPL